MDEEQSQDSQQEQESEQSPPSPRRSSGGRKAWDAASNSIQKKLGKKNSSNSGAVNAEEKAYKTAGKAASALGPEGKAVGKGLEFLAKHKNIRRLVQASSLLMNPAVPFIIIVIVVILIIMGDPALGLPEDPNQPKLTISKSGPADASAGDELSYQITVGYAGAAQDITITDALPVGTDYIDSTPPANYDPATRVATWDLADYEASPEAGLSNVNTTLTLRLRATEDNLFLINQATGTVIGAGFGGPISDDIAALLPNPLPPDPEGVEETKNQALSAITQHKSIYEQVAQATGIPWQVFAGIHYREGSARPNTSLVSGRDIGGNEPDVVAGLGCSSDAPQGVDDGLPEPFSGGCKFASMLDSGLYGGNLLKGKVGGEITSFELLVKALSRYNGGGNSNCGKGVPYGGCPKLFDGEDDTYVMNFFDTKHKPMFVIYCADYTKCNPPLEDARPGTATVAKWAAQGGTQ